MKSKILSVDIGGTFTKYSVVNSDGTMSERERFATPETYEKLIEKIAVLQKSLVCDNNTIAISSPCNYYDGALRGSSFVKYLVDKDIIQDFKNKYNLDVLIENDGNCAILCEYWVGNARNLTSSLSLVIGSGIGGGVILGDKLLKGTINLAGDLGYMILATEPKTNGVSNTFGILGATKHIYERASEVEPIKQVEDLFATELTNPDLIKIRDEMCMTIAIGVINYKYIFDPEVILIGGEISKNDNFIKHININIDKVFSELSGFKFKPTINTTKFFNDSNLIGAASLYFNPIGRL